MNFKLYGCRYYYAIVFCALVLVLNCARHDSSESEEIILAKVADRTITLTEFIKRAEYTIRPPYAKYDSPVEKRIILNSLIAEKLFSLEAGDDNELSKNASFRAYIQGRKEQAMRKWLYQKEGYDKVKLDSSALAKTVFYSGREYKIAYFSVGDSATAADVKSRLEDGIPFEQIYNQIYRLREIPLRTVDWRSEENETINEIFFTDSLAVDQVIGPVETDDHLWTTMKIVGWTFQPIITESQRNDRWADVTERTYRSEALRRYGTFIARVMKGKKVKFVGSTFFKFVDLIRPYYLASSEHLENSFQDQVWPNQDEADAVDDQSNSYLEIKDQPILQLDGDVWTVENLQKELAHHPFVFRSRQLNSKNFPEQTKLAIVDLIRDKFLTGEAYRRGYDDVNLVRYETQMWQDAMNSLYHREQILKASGNTLSFSKEYMEIIGQSLNPYIETLLKKYSDKIFINTEVFRKIKLTHIDMFAKDTNVPYPVVVPGFPILTTDIHLDYGQILKK